MDSKRPHTSLANNRGERPVWRETTGRGNWLDCPPTSTGCLQQVAAVVKGARRWSRAGWRPFEVKWRLATTLSRLSVVRWMSSVLEVLRLCHRVHSDNLSRNKTAKLTMAASISVAEDIVNWLESDENLQQVCLHATIGLNSLLACSVRQYCWRVHTFN